MIYRDAIFYIFFIGLFFLIIPSVTAQDDISQFEWMIGSWKGHVKEGEISENWIRQDENTLIGKAFYVEKGDTLLTEQLRIQKIGKYITFIPIVGNSHPVLFVLVDAKDKQWVFENKEHDFPQRVVYSLQEDGSLLAWIEGEKGGKLMKEEYLMKK